MSQDIVLVSNASMELFPGNKLSDFRVRLPQPVTLDPSFRVALTRISFTKSYFNYEGGAAQVILSDTNEIFDPNEETKKESTLICRLLPGYYTPETLLKMINHKMKTKIKIKGGGLSMKEAPVFSLTNGYLSTKHGEIDAGDNKTYKWTVMFDPITAQILGIHDPKNLRPVFVNQGYTDIYVYSDIVYPSIVGDKTCELLTILDGQTERNFGAHCCEVMEKPWYHKLAKTNFQEIRIYLRTDTGKAPKFRFGRVSLRLSFKRQDAV